MHSYSKAPLHFQHGNDVKEYSLLLYPTSSPLSFSPLNSKTRSSSLEEEGSWKVWAEPTVLSRCWKPYSRRRLFWDRLLLMNTKQPKALSKARPEERGELVSCCCCLDSPSSSLGWRAAERTPRLISHRGHCVVCVDLKEGRVPQESDAIPGVCPKLVQWVYVMCGPV